MANMVFGGSMKVQRLPTLGQLMTIILCRRLRMGYRRTFRRPRDLLPIQGARDHPRTLGEQTFQLTATNMEQV
jgi:hypothetical protein